MTSVSTIQEDLLNRDGSCRDINLAEWISKDDAIAVIELVQESWSLVQSVDGEGQQLSLPETMSLLLHATGSAQMIWKREDFIPHLQLYCHWSSPTQYFCELTFFPNDLDVESFEMQTFFSFLKSLLSASHSEEYYVRYENASWKHGDISPDSGIIFSHHDNVPI